MKVFIVGAYGCGNYGDDAILQAICENLKEYEIITTTGRVKNIADELPVKSVPCRLNEGFSIHIFLEMIVDGARMMREIIFSDALLFGGGSLIHDLTIYNLPFMFLWQRIAALFKKPTYYVCIGIGPIDTNRGKKTAKKWLARAAGVFPRDQRGADFCQNNNILNSFPASDAAFSYTLRLSNRNELLNRFKLEDGNYICVTASRWLKNENYWRKEDEQNNRLIINNFLDCITAIQELLNRKVVFVPSEHRDFVLGEKMQAWSKKDFIVLPTTLCCTEVEEIVESSYMVFGMRMHPLIFALRQGVPVISVIYDEKVRELMKKMDLLEFSIDLDRLTPDLAVEKVMLLEKNREQIIKKINENAEKCAREAKSCFEKIKKDMENQQFEKES